ncbi:glycerol kinase [Verminephrobacter aporrectodeae subsp. tuberculatae]|uniref:FGGY family carbohydrate kinase n=1 Tax=Verminephrobacter aporrectodeae TaxID=1110389 RepID=UPI0022373886|nr:FGGY family carbohydrate kinase [Verminephrobacter aporrectodeae]MCW5257952.1 glycerol kinase [Verminephrobacter aporrectodeae subsp. tuberculatae]
MNPSFAAIDQGTSSTRLLLASAGAAPQLPLALRNASQHPRPGWVEQAPLELLSKVEACLQAAGRVQAIGIANQGESCLAWDARSGEPLSPVIVWQDDRTAQQLAALRAEGVQALTLERAGLPLDCYFSASKLGWLLRNDAGVARAHRAGRLRLGTTDAFFLDRLTGQFVTDASTASRTSLMNLASGAWDPTLCALFGVPMECLPAIRPTVGDFGLYRGIPVTASIVDQQAALYGHGCRAAGDAKITFGTGAFALALTGAQIPRAPTSGLLPTVAWQIGAERSYALDGGVYDAGSAVEWAGRIGLYTDLSEITAFGAAPAIARGLAFVPALSGLACPHWDRSAAALWVGMNAATTRQDLCQALLEGIALRTAQVVRVMDGHIGAAVRLRIDGGLARNPYFCQFLADATGRSVATRRFDELTALGCAALAARGVGQTLETPDDDDDVASLFEPRTAPADALAWQLRFAEAVSKTMGWKRELSAVA